MAKNKKAQFYLFVALIISVTAYSVFSQVSKSADSYSDFDILYENYIYESNNVINNALYEDKELFVEFERFTQNFISYADSKSTDFKILYMLKLDDDIRISNHLKKSIEISSHNLTLQNGFWTTINSTSTVTLFYNENTYNYSFSGDYVELKAFVLKDEKI